MKKVYHFFLLLIVFLISSCDSQDVIEEVPKPIIKFNYNYGNDLKSNFYGTVLDISGKAIGNATVTIGNNSVQTNDKGFFVLPKANVKENYALIQFSKSGFINTSKILIPSKGENKVNVMMIPIVTTSTINSGASSTVNLSNGTSVTFDGHFSDEKGNAYSGKIHVALYYLSSFYLDYTDHFFTEKMPGSLLASDSNGDPKALKSYGMLNIQLTGENGQKLYLTKEHSADVVFRIDDDQEPYAPSIISFWTFDEATGVWSQQGTSNVSNPRNGYSRTYITKVTTLNWLSWGVPFDLSMVKFNVIDSAGKPLSDVKIGLHNYSYPTTGYTDINGLTSKLIIPSNTKYAFRVYDECGNALTLKYIDLFAPNSNNEVTITVENSQHVKTYTAKGVFKDCAGNNIKNGVVFFNTGSTNYFSNKMLPVVDGEFRISTINSVLCTVNKPFKMQAFDLSTMQSTNEIVLNPTNADFNLGNVQICSTYKEFIKYQIDNGADQFSTEGFYANIIDNNLYIGGKLVQFGLSASRINSEGTYTSGISLIINNREYINENQLVLKITHLGAIGDYIDFTITGTFVDNNIVKTINGSGHVKRLK